MTLMKVVYFLNIHLHVTVQDSALGCVVLCLPHVRTSSARIVVLLQTRN
jgi:hypothetical protein